MFFKFLVQPRSPLKPTKHKRAFPASQSHSGKSKSSIGLQCCTRLSLNNFANVTTRVCTTRQEREPYRRRRYKIVFPGERIWCPRQSRVDQLENTRNRIRIAMGLRVAGCTSTILITRETRRSQTWFELGIEFVEFTTAVSMRIVTRLDEFASSRKREYSVLYFWWN